MAKVDRNKLLATAQKLIQRGDLAKAVQQYEKLLEAYPKDVQSLLRLAGLYVRVNRADDAVSSYMAAGHQYAETGFYQKAVAAYKQALQLRENDAELQKQLGSLYQKMGLKSPAVEHYTNAAQLFAQQGQYPQAIEIMQTVLDLEPDRPDLKARYGEYLYQAGHKEDAIGVFRGLIEILKIEGQWEDLARFYERILQISPDDAEIGLDLARTYLRLGLAPKALQRLKTLFEHGVRGAEVFDLLARAYVLLGKNDKAVSAYLEKVKRLDKAADAEEIEKTYRRILEIDPTNETALMALGDGDDESEVLHVVEEEAQPQRETVVEVVALDEEPEDAILLQGEDDEGTGHNSEFSEILQEASVYIRYGIRAKALRKLEQILARDPQNLAALKKRVEVYRESEPSRAIPDLIRLSEIYEGLGNLDAAERFIEEAKKIDPDHPALREYLGLGTADEVLPGDAGSDAGPVAEVVFADGDQPVAEVESEPVFPDADEFLTQAEAEDELDIELDVEGDFGEPTVEAGLESQPEAEPWADELEQASFFLETGLEDEARKLVEDLVARFGEQKAFAPLLERLGGAAAEQPAPTAQGGASGDDTGTSAIFDIARELEEELDFAEVADVSPGAEDVPTFEEIFEAFKKGVKEQLSDDDANAHYDLGIAYMEMGLMDEALAEFELVLRNENMAADAYNMMAITLTRKGDLEGAVEKYRAGLALEGLDEAIALNMNYEAAVLLEELGRYKEALLHYKQVVQMDRDYRDVAKCLKRMRDKIQAIKSGAATAA